MVRILIIGFFALQTCLTVGQKSFFEPTEEPNKGRLIGTSSAIGSLWAGSLIGLHQVWYSDSWGDDFHSFDDSRQWLQMDKAGHFFTGQLLAQHSSSAFRWSGLSRKKSSVIGSLISFGYLSSFELMDGRAEEWGFSWSDLSANALGCGWFLWQDLVWQEQRLQLKFSAHLSPYAQYRPNVLGSTFAERLLKDYNGQTYWLSINPSSFMDRETRFPKWLNIAFGYSVDEKLVGDQEVYVHFGPTDGQTFFESRRQFLLSLDIDLTRLPVKKPWLKTLCTALNHVKIPFPTIEFSSNGTQAYGLYF